MIRIATIGTSAITRSLLDAACQVEGIAFIGTCSRSIERAEVFTKEHGGDRAFSSVSEVAACPEVDAVYIASPNAFHHDQALACIAAGKHVLVEKPFCANEREAREVFEAAEAAGVIALEAMRPLHDPAFCVVRDALGELGALRRVTLRFGKYSSRYDEVLAGRHTNIFDCAMASGSLMDIGVYSVEPLIALFGAPASVSATAVLLDESTRPITNGPIDGAGVILASYPGMVASLHHAKIVTDLANSQFEGELGTLTVEGISSPKRAVLSVRVPGGTNDAVGYSSTKATTHELDLPHCDNTMVYELADFAAACEAVRDGSPATDAPAGPFGTVSRLRAITLASLALMDKARFQMGVTFPADLR